jgi:hypothetical protein
MYGMFRCQTGACATWGDYYQEYVWMSKLMLSCADFEQKLGHVFSMTKTQCQLFQVLVVPRKMMSYK